MSSVRTLCVCVDGPEKPISAPACAAALCDLVKYVLYQKLQVPYTYELLRRSVVDRKTIPDVRESAQSSKHFRTVSLCFENLEKIFKALAVEMSSPQPPTEVCLLLGATLVSCREVYRLVLPSQHHKPSCSMDHVTAGHHLSMALLKTLTTSEVFDEMIIKPLAPTNLHILVKKPFSNSELPVNPEHFAPSRGCRIPRSAKLAVIHLPDTSSPDLSCCSGFQIFDDFNNCDRKLSIQGRNLDLNDLKMNLTYLNDMCKMETTEKDQWFQASTVVKGFKDVCINGISITNQWLKAQEK